MVFVGKVSTIVIVVGNSIAIAVVITRVAGAILIEVGLVLVCNLRAVVVSIGYAIHIPIIFRHTAGPASPPGTTGTR